MNEDWTVHLLRRITKRLIASTLFVYVAVSILGAVVLAEVAVHPRRLPLHPAGSFRQINERQYGATLDDAAITAADGVTLRGWVMQPKNYNGNAVIILHGVADNRESATGFAGSFLSKGYVVLTPDSRAHGGSGGSHITYGIREREDIRRWIDWLSTRAAPHCVYVLGESMGAAIAIQATAADRRICAVVAESPFATFREIAFERIGQMAGTGPWMGRIAARPMVELAFLVARFRYGVDLAEASPLKAMETASTPVLLIHGAADSNILPRNSQELHRAAPTHSELWIVPGTEHCGASATQPGEFDRRVREWFEKHPAPLP